MSVPLVKGKEVSSMSNEKSTPTRAAAPQGEPVEERIRRRAYELYQARGREDGHELEDWQQAEAEITIGRKTIAA
jgi:hypothetical protein